MTEAPKQEGAFGGFKIVQEPPKQETAFGGFKMT
jgi:hypothetical protein